VSYKLCKILKLEKALGTLGYQNAQLQPRDIQAEEKVQTYSAVCSHYSVGHSEIYLYRCSLYEY
jgi:hypothetical protein